jgi:antitoxin component of RelBE/YafQ-DinJ toxin-antitoxin module
MQAISLTNRLQMLYNVIIMSNALLSIRTDDATKREITEFAGAVGLSVSAFVTVVLKQTVKEGRVILSPNLEPTPYLEKIMREARADRKADRNYTTVKTPAELKNFFKSL